MRPHGSDYVGTGLVIFVPPELLIFLAMCRDDLREKENVILPLCVFKYSFSERQDLNTNKILKCQLIFALGSDELVKPFAPEFIKRHHASIQDRLKQSLFVGKIVSDRGCVFLLGLLVYVPNRRGINPTPAHQFFAGEQKRFTRSLRFARR